MSFPRSAFRIRHLGLLLVAAAVGSGACIFRRAPLRTLEDVDQGFTDVHPSLLVTNPRVLDALELDRFSFGDVLGVHHNGEPRRTNYREESADALLASPIYSDLVDALKRELGALESTISDTGVGPEFEHRIFDPQWLTSKRVHFELVGVVNRLDFRVLVPPGCGQTRLVYRIAYQPANRPQTRLPLTINVLYENRETDCGAVARRWRALEASRPRLSPDGAMKGESSNDLVAALMSGPLAHVEPSHFDSLEVDIQSMRENSDGPGMDDHAEYILRELIVQDGHLVPAPLRNMPELALDETQKEALRLWVAQNFDAIESGRAELPVAFQAKRAISVTPRGMSRLANRPWKTLFPDENESFGELPYAGKQIAISPAMLVRRLDEMTCTGCHESRSIAGFHLLGEDRTGGTANAMVTGTSEHLRAILDWRFGFLTAVSEGRVPTEPVPLAEHVDDRGEYGAHCTSTSDSAVLDWPCAPGFTCAPNPVEGDPIGQCVVTGNKQVGDSCQGVRLETMIGPAGDTVYPKRSEKCTSRHDRQLKCDVNKNGFAGGMCTGECPNEGERIDGNLCARIPRFGFERECFKSDAILEKCLLEPGKSTLELLRPCSRTVACRDDYVCARMPATPHDQGACVPPYFIFQARVDGPPVDR